jgi:hypothetical protein
VLFLGLPDGDESEGADREHLDLPANQVALVPRVAAVNRNLVVVLANGSVVRLSPWDRTRRPGSCSATSRCAPSRRSPGSASTTRSSPR